MLEKLENRPRRAARREHRVVRSNPAADLGCVTDEEFLLRSSICHNVKPTYSCVNESQIIVMWQIALIDCLLSFHFRNTIALGLAARLKKEALTVFTATLVTMKELEV